MDDLELYLQEIAKLLGSVRFVHAPIGEAPFEIREAWVGVEVPCFYRHETVSTGIISRLHTKYDAYAILQTRAINALALKSPEAARYWNHIGYPQHEMAMFAFNVASAIETKPVMSEEAFYAALHSLGKS